MWWHLRVRNWVPLPRLKKIRGAFRWQMVADGIAVVICGGIGV